MKSLLKNTVVQAPHPNFGGKLSLLRRESHRPPRPSSDSADLEHRRAVLDLDAILRSTSSKSQLLSSSSNIYPIRERNFSVCDFHRSQIEDSATAQFSLRAADVARRPPSLRLLTPSLCRERPVMSCLAFSIPPSVATSEPSGSWPKNNKDNRE